MTLHHNVPSFVELLRSPLDLNSNDIPVKVIMSAVLCRDLLWIHSRVQCMPANSFMLNKRPPAAISAIWLMENSFFPFFFLFFLVKRADSGIMQEYCRAILSWLSKKRSFFPNASVPRLHNEQRLSHQLGDLVCKLFARTLCLRIISRCIWEQ